MQNVKVTDEDRKYMSDAEIKELLASKVLDAWGVPMSGLTVYGRLQWLDTWYPEAIELLKEAIRKNPTP